MIFSEDFPIRCTWNHGGREVCGAVATKMLHCKATCGCVQEAPACEPVVQLLVPRIPIRLPSLTVCKEHGPQYGRVDGHRDFNEGDLP